MIISNSKKFIFIHIYKTGGTSVNASLLPYGRIVEKISTYWFTKSIIGQINNLLKLQDDGNRWINGVHKHATAMEIREYLGALVFDKYFKFVIVRNPLDLQVSLYHYIKQNKGHRDYEIANKLTFKEFMYREIENEAPRQCDFLMNNEGELIVDYIGKTERLQQSIDYVCNHLSLKKIVIEKRNISQRKKSYLDYYDNDLLEKVCNYFKKDFEYLGYEKPL